MEEKWGCGEEKRNASAFKAFLQPRTPLLFCNKNSMCKVLSDPTVVCA